MRALNGKHVTARVAAAGGVVVAALVCGVLGGCSSPAQQAEVADGSGVKLHSGAHDSFASFLEEYELAAGPVEEAAGEAPAELSPEPALNHGASYAAEEQEGDRSQEETVAEEPWLRIKEIGLADEGDGRALVLKLSRTPDIIDYFNLTSPNRLVLDLAGPVDSFQLPGSFPAGDEIIERVRVGVKEERIRVVADLGVDEIPPYSVEQHGPEVTLLLGTEEAREQASSKTLYEARGPAELMTGAIEEEQPDIQLSQAVPEDAQIPAQVQPQEREERRETAVPGGSPQGMTAPKAEAKEAGSGEPQSYSEEEAVEVPLEKIERVPERPLVVAMPAVSEPQGKGEVAPPEEKPEQHAMVRREVPLPVPRKPAIKRKYTGRPISLDFKNADIQNVLRIIADVSGLNIVATDDVAGRVTIRLKDVPWDQALDVILQANGLDKERQGNIIRISSLDRLREEREKARAAQDALALAERLKVKYVRVNYAKVNKDFMAKIERVLSDRGKVTWDERTNTIVIRDIQQGIDDASEMIAAFDMQTPQVLIESAIVEASDDFTRDLGIQWGYNFKSGPQVGNNTGFNFPGTVAVGGTGGGSETFPALPGFPFIADFPAKTAGGGAGSALDLALGSLDGSQSLSARLTALESKNRVKIISRPRVVTINNVKATIQSLRILRVRLPSTGTVISTGEGGVAGGNQVATEEIPIGITLEVTPQVSSDGYIFLDVMAKSSTTAPTSSPDGIPDEISRQAESHVLVPDGETFVLGGIYKDNVNSASTGVPYLKDLPVLGWLFRNHFRQDMREELLVFVTPHIIKGSTTVANLPSASELWQSRNKRGE